MMNMNITSSKNLQRIGNKINIIEAYEKYMHIHTKYSKKYHENKQNFSKT